MPQHVFVDESKANGLLMAAIRCPSAEVNEHRRTMAGLLMPRERRIHFTKESPARRRKILAVIGEIGLAARLYQAERNDVAARRSCLSALARDIAGSAERLVVERDESTVTVDKQVLFHAARRHDCSDSLQGEWREFVAPYSTVIRV